MKEGTRVWLFTCLQHAVQPSTHLIGFSDDGDFATAAAKEYPALNRCFASVLKCLESDKQCALVE